MLSLRDKIRGSEISIRKVTGVNGISSYVMKWGMGNKMADGTYTQATWKIHKEGGRKVLNS